MPTQALPAGTLVLGLGFRDPGALKISTGGSGVEVAVCVSHSVPFPGHKQPAHTLGVTFDPQGQGL